MKLWYDVSGIYNWRGAFTGIQRVVYNLAEELEHSDIDIHLFIYLHGNFTEVSYDQLRQRRTELDHLPRTKTDITTERLTLGKLQHQGMVTAKQLVRGSRLEKPLRNMYAGLRTSYRGVRTHRIHPTVTAPFAKDDTVMVVDGNWQFRDYAEQLIAAKTTIGFKLAHVVHDMVALRNPALVNKGAKKIIGGYFEMIFEAADSLIAVSESTKRDIEWFLERHHISNQPAIPIVLEGDNLSSQSGQELRKPASELPKDFILSVSTLEIRKNYMELYYVYKLAKQLDVHLPHLVIVGRMGWMAEEVFALLTEDTDINQEITVLHGAPDAELEWLYKHCQFTVFPSFYEGWGLPVAESFYHGKACVSSNTSSMPEVGGTLAAYVSPYDTHQMLDAILHYTEPAVRRKAEAAIAATYKPRTWADMARDVEALFR